MYILSGPNHTKLAMNAMNAAAMTTKMLIEVSDMPTIYGWRCLLCGMLVTYASAKADMSGAAISSTNLS